MARDDFAAELRALGYAIDENGDRVTFQWTVPCGKFSDQTIKLGFVVPGDFNLTPPSGPHVSPRLMPQNPNGGNHPNNGIHESPFGPEWQYWSRPMPQWSSTKRTVRDYLAHIRHLFDTL